MKIVCAWMYAIGQYGFPPAIENVLKAIREMKDMGFEYVEAEGIGYENLDQVIAQREQIKAICDGEGLKLANFAVLLPDVISMDKKVRERAFSYFQRGVETAAYLGSPYTWIDSYFPPLEVQKGIVPTEELVYGQEFRVRIPETFEWQPFWDSFIGAIARCNQIARKNGIGLLVEPRVGEVVANSDAMLRMIEQVNDDNLGVILDIGHQYAQKELIPLSIEKLGRHMRYVHVADNDGRDNRHLVPGSGTVDWDEIFRLLKRRNFDGYFSIDLEQLPDLREKFLQTKRFLEDYAGKYRL
jgi:sugar phosphate isomerase/epimerase